MLRETRSLSGARRRGRMLAVSAVALSAGTGLAACGGDGATGANPSTLTTTMTIAAAGTRSAPTVVITRAERAWLTAVRSPALKVPPTPRRWRKTPSGFTFVNTAKIALGARLGTGQARIAVRCSRTTRLTVVMSYTTRTGSHHASTRLKSFRCVNRHPATAARVALPNAWGGAKVLTGLKRYRSLSFRFTSAPHAAVQTWFYTRG